MDYSDIEFARLVVASADSIEEQGIVPRVAVPLSELAGMCPCTLDMLNDLIQVGQVDFAHLGGWACVRFSYESSQVLIDDCRKLLDSCGGN